MRPDAARVPALAGAALLGLLAGLIALSPEVLLFDERYYMEAAYFLAGNFDFVALMQTPLDVAAGPLYAYLHFLLSPLTAMQPPTIRFVNAGCLAVTIAATWLAMRRTGHDAALSRAAMLLAVPMVWTTSGLALTELPALALASLAVLAVAAALQTKSAGKAWLLLALAGLCGGLAILGRQTYLPALAGFLAIGWSNRRLLLPSLLACLIAMATIAPMLVVWGGLTPPWQTILTTGLVPEHGILAFVYLATAALLIAPGFLTPVLKSRTGLIVLAAAVAAAFIAQWAGYRFPVASGVIARFPAALQPILGFGLNLAMLSIAAAMLFSAFVHFWERRQDRGFVLLSFIVVLLTGTAVGISHQFSSRYVLTAFPFALLLLQPWFRPGLWATGRMVVGASLGIASLSAQYAGDPSAEPYIIKSAPQELLDRMPLIENAGSRMHD